MGPRALGSVLVAAVTLSLRPRTGSSGSSSSGTSGQSHRRPTTAAAMATWKNSTDGIHSFLTFDSGATLPAIAAFGDRIDYVWGASSEAARIAAWRKANPDVVLSKYIPFTRDPACPHLSGKPGPQCNAKTPGFKEGCPDCLPWWQAHHPELVLYQCDKVTPAWECFSGEGCRHESVPLDLTNPKTLDYQISAAVKPAATEGYNAIALDNYGLSNQWKACGSFSGSNGTWVQKYSAADPRKDPQYTKDVLDWTRRAVDAIHAVGLLVIPNFSESEMTDAVLSVVNLTDGILAEGGFASWNPVCTLYRLRVVRCSLPCRTAACLRALAAVLSGSRASVAQRPNTSSFSSPPPKTTPEKFEAQIKFVRHGQSLGKGYFSINEWGAGPDYGLNPSGQPQNISGVANRPIRQVSRGKYNRTVQPIRANPRSAVPLPRCSVAAGRLIHMMASQFLTATFMIANGGSLGIYLTCIQCYGGHAGGLGNLSIWPEYSAPVGHPIADPSKDSATGVWSRSYSAGLALVNPTATVQTVALPAAAAGATSTDGSTSASASASASGASGNKWKDLYGGDAGTSATLPAASGLVLLRG